jgi:hypothetical protein
MNSRAQHRAVDRAGSPEFFILRAPEAASITGRSLQAAGGGKEPNGVAKAYIDWYLLRRRGIAPGDAELWRSTLGVEVFARAKRDAQRDQKWRHMQPNPPNSTGW